ncbi:DUF6415 family natural product biosynthesis protein [Streptomyces sp. NPDC093510]|uniref:DUF6415 family natural product biosynthesis protein n=1 Tax=Streptomyces sp. NPDC093510 TaxID=3155199 RepID=UPI003444037E
MPDHNRTQNCLGVETARLVQLVEQALAWDLGGADDMPELQGALTVIAGIHEHASLLSDALTAAVERLPPDSDLYRRVQTALGEAQRRLPQPVPQERRRAAERAQNLARLSQTLLQRAVELEAAHSLSPPRGT